MTSLATFTPAETYGDLLQVANNGLGLTTVPVQVQDGLGNVTLMTLATDLINFDRGIGELQIDGVALTADINTLNNLTDVADGVFLLQTPNAQLPNALQFATAAGLTTTSGGGLFTIQPADELLGLQNIAGVGIVVHSAINTYATRTLVTDATLSLTNGSGVAGNPTLGVVADSSLQRINVELNGVFQSTKAQINLIPGTNVGIVVMDNPGDNRTDITFSATFTQSLFFKAPCYAATTANLNATYDNGISGEGATLTNAGALAAFSVDGVSPPLGSRILVKDQTTKAYNGIYILLVVGSGASQWVLERSTDYDNVSEIEPGDSTNILNGTVNNNTTWVQVETVAVLGTDDIEWLPFGFTGTVTSVNGTANRIVVTDPTTTAVVDIASTYVGQASITTLGTITTGVWNGTTITVPNGGTGKTSFTAYSVVCAGTTSTGIFQNVVGVGALGEVLTSTGAGSLPTWQPPTRVSFDLEVNQVAHGFAVGNVIKCTGSNTFALAQADSASNAEVIGIVITVTDADNFIFQFGGLVTTGLAVTAGSVYFLDPAVAGGITSTAPSTSGQVRKPLLIAITATTGYWMNQLGEVL